MEAFFVGITGGSGAPYALSLVRALAAAGRRVHLSITESGLKVLSLECGLRLDPSAPDLASFRRGSEGEVLYHPIGAIEAPPSSGTHPVRGAVVVPCSMGTAARVAAGLSSNLVERVCDVALKEGRTLVLVPRETPLNRVHLDNLVRLAWAGATILPAMPGFYHRPRTVEDLVDHVVGKILDRLGVDHDLVRRWGEEPAGEEDFFPHAPRRG
ncbi:MAG TPA: flavin prenyltransferase UbiX [Planctomycetota bacterium]|nr:flavin prenyltransferase UbiX [Planctomycetota bacterium]